MSDKPVVYVPSYSTANIKEEIQRNEVPPYEHRSVKYQGFYKDAYTKEVRTQTIKHYSDALDSFYSYHIYTLNKKRYVITGITISLGCAAGVGGSTRYFYISQGSSSFEFKQHFNNLRSQDLFCHIDLSSSPIVIDKNEFTVGVITGLGVGDVIGYTLIGFEED